MEVLCISPAAGTGHSTAHTAIAAASTAATGTVSSQYRKTKSGGVTLDVADAAETNSGAELLLKMHSPARGQQQMITACSGAKSSIIASPLRAISLVRGEDVSLFNSSGHSFIDSPSSAAEKVRSSTVGILGILHHLTRVESLESFEPAAADGRPSQVMVLSSPLLNQEVWAAMQARSLQASPLCRVLVGT